MDEKVSGTGATVADPIPLPPTAAEMEMAARAQAEADGTTSECGSISKLIPPPPVTEYRYEIEGQKYVLREPVLGQQEQLTALFAEMKIELGHIVIDFEDLEGTLNRILKKLPINKLLVTMAGKAPRFFGIILTPEGVPFKDKKIDEVTQDLRCSMRVTLQPEVLRDFFALCGTLLKEMLRGPQRR